MSSPNLNLSNTSIGSVDEILSAFIDRRKSGKPVSAAGWLNEYAKYWEHQSIVLALALEEYCQRIQRGSEVIREDFCGEFGKHAADVAVMLKIEDACREETVAVGRDKLPVPGELFNDFEIIERLGGGGLAQVYLAREPSEIGHRYCVLKISRQRTREVSILGKLEQHSHIGEFRYVNLENSANFEMIVMPYRGRATLLDVLQLKSRDPHADGAAIAAFVRKGADLPSFSRDSKAAWPKSCNYHDAVATLLGQVAEALEFSHAKGVVHGDLKPSNVLVSFSSEAVLIDFNLAFDGLSSLYRLGGTPDYLAPELLQALIVSPSQNQMWPTPATDIYAWGIVAWELLSGQCSISPPCSVGLRRLSDLIDAHSQRQLDFSTSRLQELGVDPSLAAVVMQCLAISPEARPTARQLTELLRDWTKTSSKVTRWIRRHQAYLVALASMILLGCIAEAAWLLTRPSYDQRQLTVARQLLKEGEVTNAAIHVSLARDYQPDSIDARKCFADILLAQGNYGDAKAEYTALKAITPNSSKPDLAARIGYCHVMQKNYPEATTHFRSAIESGPREAWIMHNLGVAYLYQNKKDEAIHWLTEAIQANSSQGLSFLCRADCVAKAAKASSDAELRGAIGDVLTAKNLGPPHADHELVLGVLWDKTSNRPDRVDHIYDSLSNAIALGADAESDRIQWMAKKNGIAIGTKPVSEPRGVYTPLPRFIAPSLLKELSR